MELSIYLYGPTESGFLDLLPGAVLNMESEADIFDEDLSTGDFSLPIDIPWTDKNKRLTGFAERLQNIPPSPAGEGLGVRQFKVTVYDSGFPELPTALLTFIGKDGKFSYATGKSSATITGTKGLFGSKIKNKKLTDLNMGGKISWDTMDSRQFAESVMKGNYPEYSYMRFGPVAIENFFDSSRPDYANEFLAKDTVNTPVINGAGPDGWVFGRPKPDSPSEAATAGTADYADYRTVPFLKTKYVLQRVFGENGFTLTGDFITSADYDDLFTFNNYAIENYSPDFYDFNRVIFLNNHVPQNMLIIDYLKGILSLFSMYAVFTGDTNVELRFRKDRTKQKKVFSLNGLCSGAFTSGVQTLENNDGYKLAYDFANDGYAGDRVKDLKDKTLVATVTTLPELGTVNAGRQLTTDDIAFVTAENLYYNVADATTDPVKWDCYAEELSEFISGAGDRNVDMPVSTLCTYAELQEDTGLYLKKDYVGCRMAGSYINNKGVLVKNDCGNKIFFLKRRNNSSNVLIPFSYNHNRDEANNLINAFSLAWKTSTGMAAIFHENWQALKQNMETVKTSITANRRVISGVDVATSLEISGIDFILSKKENTIPAGETMDVELVVA